MVAAALPGYEIGGEIGHGGWGVVLEGRHRQLDREVAIKQLPAAFAADPSVRARFVAEARVLASLDHPHVVPIYDYVEREDICLLVMEKLPGGTVWQRFATSGLTMPEVCAIVLATCSGLHAAHQKGILHRDVKPENLIFSAAKTLKVTDFGIAKVLTGSETKATRGGEVLGTPAYMAPEQVQNRELTPATDVYAVGMMLYELLSGRLPFSQEDPIALLFCQVNDVPPPLSGVAPLVPPAIAAVSMKALEKDPLARFATAEDLGVSLAEAATGAWSAGWLQQSDVPVMGTGRLASVTLEAQGGVRTSPPRPAAPPTVVTSAESVAAIGAGAAPETGEGAPAPVASAPDSLAPLDLAPAPESLPPPPVVSTAPMNIIRADAPEERARGANAAELADAGLVGIQEVVRRPPMPTGPLLTAAAFLLVCVAIAFVGLGVSNTKPGDITPGMISVAGIDPALGKVVPVDLKEPLVISGTLPSGAKAADHLRLSFSFGAVPIGHFDAAITPAPGGRFSTALDATGYRYIIASDTTTNLSFEASGTTVAQRSFVLRTAQKWYLTLPGALAIALVLFAVAYIESLLRALRRGRKQVSGVIGLAVIGAVVGLVAVSWAWLLEAVMPTTATEIMCAILGTAAGLAAGVAAQRLGRRRQLRTAHRPARF
ncbi:MAG: hypothetical protein QOK39_2468 [Acidimicrobiaceae bacterium]|nr:hypothetical protein [Acidimicrobiaceae bacterium]